MEMREDVKKSLKMHPEDSDFSRLFSILMIWTARKEQIVQWKILRPLDREILQ